MTEEKLGRGDPVIRRLQQAFAHEEPATDLAAVMKRAARYQAGGPPDAQDPPRPGHGLTAADLVAARRREPAAVSRIYAAYAPALFRFFLATVGESLPRFRGPVDGLGGWLFQIARHDLFDFRRRQARSRIEPLEDNVGEAAAAASAPGVLGWRSGTEPALGTGEITHPALHRLSVREREILGLLAKGWSNRRIAEQCFLSLNTVRTHVQNILVKLDVNSKPEAVAFAFERGWTSGPVGLDALAMGHLEDTQVVAALQQLSPDQREVMLLTMVAGLTAPEVAAIVGKTIGQVKALRQRGLAALAEVLDLESSY
jgi:DNA-directed RNA polymerase specialized sigma24 family protein